MAGVRAPGSRRPLVGSRGFNLIELLMAMAMSTIIFMSITALYAYQARSLGSQHHVQTMDREARFAMEHLRRDLMTMGSHTTPNSDADGWVCPKPAVPIRAIQLALNDGDQIAPSLNPYVRSLSMRLFGSLDVKTRFRTVSIAGAVVTLEDDGSLPSTDDAWNDTFTTDRFLRLSGADGKMMFYGIKSSDRSTRQVVLVSAPPRISGTQLCGYQGNGENMWVDVQGFVRYRVIADERPSAPTDAKNKPLRTLLVRERLETDGIKVAGALPLAENVVELGIYDAIFDTNADPDKVGPTNMPDFQKSGLVLANGSGYLGKSGNMLPERLRALNVVLSLRTAEEVSGVTHDPRTHVQSPLVTYKLNSDTVAACRVHTVAGRVAMPTMVARNL